MVSAASNCSLLSSDLDDLALLCVVAIDAAAVDALEDEVSRLRLTL